MSDVTLRATDVGFHVDDKSLVADVSFESTAGEIVGLIGPNGAGKSTLLRLLGGDLRPSTGEIELLGGSVIDVSPSELALRRAMLGSNPPSDIALTARTVVAFGRHPHHGLPTNTDAMDITEVDRAMDVTGVSQLSDRPFYTLSGGEQARVHVARVLAQKSPVLLFDEPTATLDMANAELILATLQTAARNGDTVVCVIHDLNAAAHYCDRLLLLGDGRLRAVGHPSEVLSGDLLSEVYLHEMKVVDHPFRECPLVLVG